MTNKVHFTIRLDPKLLAYIKQQAPDNMSRFVEELVRKHAADNIQDDTFERLKRAIASDSQFLQAVVQAVADKLGVTAQVSDKGEQLERWELKYDPKRPMWSPFGTIPLEPNPFNPKSVCDPNLDPDQWIPMDVDERNAWLERQ